MQDIRRVIQEKFRFRSRYDNLPWSSPRGTRITLAETFAALGYQHGAEIGVRYGNYSMALCKANPSLRLVCIDPWAAYSHLSQARQDEIYAQAVINLSPYSVRIIRKSSMDALEDIPDAALDFVYIDGNHEFDHAMMDIIKWAPKVRQGGIIGVHDYFNFHRAGVVKAVDAYTHCHCINPWYVTREREPTAFWVNP